MLFGGIVGTAGGAGFPTQEIVDSRPLLSITSIEDVTVGEEGVPQGRVGDLSAYAFLNVFAI